MPETRIAGGEKEDFQVVGFNIGGEEYGIDILEIVGVERLANVLQLPKMPPFIEGVMRIRDEVVPLIKLRTRFGLSEKANDEHTRVMVISVRGSTVGYIVDSVTSVRRLRREAVEQAPPMALTVEGTFVNGVIKMDDRMIIILNPDQILAEEESSMLGRASAVAKHYTSDQR